MKNNFLLLTVALLFIAFSSFGQETGTFTDTRDGRTYKTVKIGTQTWMAENLNYETENSCCFNFNSDFCVKYGRLYTFEDAKKACPAGWHIPSESEWITLRNYLGGNQAVNKIRGGPFGLISKIANSSGFTGLAGGLAKDFLDIYRLAAYIGRVDAIDTIREGKFKFIQLSDLNISKPVPGTLATDYVFFNAYPKPGILPLPDIHLSGLWPFRDCGFNAFWWSADMKGEKGRAFRINCSAVKAYSSMTNKELYFGLSVRCIKD